ncbi:hypothetical protein pb186bvf_001385 [Paramecium bursaria]
MIQESISEQQTASQTGDNFNKKQFSRSLPKKRGCSNCIQLYEEVQKMNNMVQQMKRVEQLLLNQVKDVKVQLEDVTRQNIRYQNTIDELNKELNNIQDKLHQESMTNGIQSKTNIELKRNILQLEQDAIKIKKDSQVYEDELSNLKVAYSHEHKFIESLLHMVMSCHPSQKELPTLKQAWKWLKMILSDYMQLKQQSKRQENSGQSSSSTNK